MTPAQLNLIKQAATVDLDAEEWRDALGHWLDAVEWQADIDKTVAWLRAGGGLP